MKYEYFLASLSEMLGVWKIRRLLASFENARAFYESDTGSINGIYGITEADIHKIARQKREWDLEKKQEELLQKKIRLITSEQEEYPSCLREISDAPYALFVKGKLPEAGKRRIAIVGARGCSEYGREIAGKLAEKLASAQVQVVSGMAKGIDSAGHYGALRGGGETFAVLGCGTDVCYPSESRLLYEKIEASGGLISEYVPGAAPLARRFPMRNRIISGLCDIVVVVEAKERSGSLITADFALEQGREIYAVPGRMTDALSMGCNRLIKQGAGLVLSLEDFLRDLEIETGKTNGEKDFSKKLLEKEELLVYSVLDLQPKSIDEIMRATETELLQVIQSLMSLQNKGFIREIYKNYYIRTLG